MTTLQEEKMKRCIDSLAPSFKERVLHWIEDVKALGIVPYIYCGYRTNEEQNALYAQGRTIKGTIVTNAKASQSFHNYRLAFDFVPMKDGECDWDNEETYDKCAEVGKKYNFRALSFETPHLEDATYNNWRDLYSKWYGDIEKPSVAKEEPKKLDPKIRDMVSRMQNRH